MAGFGYRMECLGKHQDILCLYENPHSTEMSLTNQVERVVWSLGKAGHLEGVKHLLYLDTAGYFDEIIFNSNEDGYFFVDFKIWNEREVKWIVEALDQ